MLESPNNVVSEDPPKTYNYFYVAATSCVFLIAATLRVSLSWVNREANDNHYEVIRLILEGRTGLTMLDCHECFHPKLFYSVCAFCFQLLSITDESSRIIAGQLLNSLAGMLTLVLVFLTINSSAYPAKWRFWIFTLIAINPRFIAINGQLSNDSFAILFATSAIYFTMTLLKTPSYWSAIVTQGMLSLALMTKGTTWVVGIAMLIVLLIRAMKDESRKTSIFFVVLYVITSLNGLLSIQFAGYDFERYDVYANRGRGTPLYFWEKTDVGRPGVQSIVDGYLTFRIVSLLRDPQITNGVSNEQSHRTSVWTQLYARANFAQYEQHPKSWRTTDRNALSVAKCSIVLGLLPLAFLWMGIASGFVRTVGAWRTWGIRGFDYSRFFCSLLCAGYIAFIIKFTADYRDFAAIKLIYMLPGVLPFSLAMLDGAQKVAGPLARIRIVRHLLDGILGSVILLHALGIVLLVRQLANSP
jgi:Dolichyl-phosphate-mannose-protein mannosyltransferase